MKRNPRPALQLYSIRDYIAANGLPRALEEIAKLGYEGVEFAGYWGFSAPELAKMLAASGLVACGTHLDRSAFAPDKLAEALGLPETRRPVFAQTVGRPAPEE